MRFAVIGSPVAHSRSPAMHTAAYRALELDHTYDKIETTAEELPARIAALRAGELHGINVTVPHKSAVLSLVDTVAPSAAAIGAANTLVRGEDGRITAHNTDASALARELAALAEGNSLLGETALVLGSGGAARAAVFALGALGLGTVLLRARRDVPDFAQVLASGEAAAGHEPSARLIYEPLEAPKREADDLAVIVQCTTAGMEGGPDGSIVADAVDWESVPSSCVVYDVVYAPAETVFLEEAAERGLIYANGVGMLVAQGAIAFSLWLGVEPPRDVMLAAIRGLPGSSQTKSAMKRL